jgi:hypothetical protein
VAEQVLRLLKDSPALEEARRARDEKRLATIRERIVERDRIKREQAETMPRLQRAVEGAAQKERRLHDELQAAIRERVNAEHARVGASGDFSLRLSQVEAEIKKAAPREIDEFIYEMLKADEKARLELDVEQ